MDENVKNRLVDHEERIEALEEKVNALLTEGRERVEVQPKVVPHEDVAPRAASLSKAVMASSGTNILDLAKIQVPCQTYAKNYVMLDGSHIKATCQAEYTNEGSAEEVWIDLSPSNRRLLAQMLIQSADVEEDVEEMGRR